VRKYVIITVLGLCLLLGGWIYACVGQIPWLSEAARGATHSMALSMGMHVFDPSPAGPAAEKKETVANLPDGFYLYLGQKPANTNPKWVVVNPGGGISWLDKADPKTSNAGAAGGAAATPVAMPAGAQFETYDYPVIKWKATPLPGTSGAVAQLSTTYERATGAAPQGTVKYRLTIYKSNSKARVVQLLDADGFKLQQFTATDFHEIPGSEQLLEARDSFPAEESVYRQWRAYSVD
jgi:hypothetical protein